MTNPAAPSPDTDFTAEVDRRLTGFLSRQGDVVRGISDEADSLTQRLRELTRGGKRLRPLFAFWGAIAAGSDGRDPALADIGAAIELFQAAALIHDDIIDHSDTRRGGPSVHRRFEGIHRDSGWALDPEPFGQAAAILAGDLALSFSSQLFAAAGPTPRARELFDAMHTQVMVGQYLDVLEEQKGPARTPDEALSAALTVVRYKSAKYSVENPVLLGAAQAGADEALLRRLSAAALPLGEAFQLRDDELGVFGDPETTGKPAGDDLREGKRTALVALTLQRTDAAGARILGEALGRGDLGADQVARVQDLIRDSGALAAHEDLIGELTERAFAALHDAGLPAAAVAGLEAVGTAAVRRRS